MSRPSGSIKELIYCSTHTSSVYGRDLSVERDGVFFDGIHAYTPDLTLDQLYEAPQYFRRIYRGPVRSRTNRHESVCDVDQCPYCGNTYVHECPKCGLLVCSADQAPQRCLGCSEWGISPPMNDPTIPVAAQPPRFTLMRRYFSFIGFLSDSALDWRLGGTSGLGRPKMAAGKLRRRLSQQVENAKTWWLERQAKLWR